MNVTDAILGLEQAIGRLLPYILRLLILMLVPALVASVIMIFATNWLVNDVLGLQDVALAFGTALGWMAVFLVVAVLWRQANGYWRVLERTQQFTTLWRRVRAAHENWDAGTLDYDEAVTEIDAVREEYHHLATSLNVTRHDDA